MNIAVLRYRSLGDVIHAVAATSEMILANQNIEKITFYTGKALLDLVRELFDLLIDDDDSRIVVCSREELHDLDPETLLIDLQGNLRSLPFFSRKKKITRSVKRLLRLKQELSLFRAPEPELDSLANFRTLIKSAGFSLKEHENYRDYKAKVKGPLLWIQAAAWPSKMINPDTLKMFLEYRDEIRILKGKNVDLSDLDESKLCPQNDFSEILNSIRSSSFVISGDTGLFHLAELLGVPGILLTGATGPESGVFAHHKLSIMKSRQLACSPCSFNGKEGCYYPNKLKVPCMDFSRIELNKIIENYIEKLPI